MRRDDERLIAEGLRDALRTLEDLGEQVRTARDYIGALRRLGLRVAARDVEDTIDRSWCMERGVCPNCGDDLDSREVPEWHPYGSTVVRESRYAAYCPECGWEAE